MGTSANLLAINWEAWTAGATTAYALFAGVAAFVVVIIWKQVKAAEEHLEATNKARRLQALNEIFRLIHTAAAKAARGAIYRSTLDEFSDAELEHLMQANAPGLWRRITRELTPESIEMTADMWHHVGLLAEKQLVERDVLFDYFAWPLLNSFRRMKRYIRWRQSRDNPGYAEHFVSLAGDFEDRFKGKFGDGLFFSRFAVPTLKDR